VEFVVEKVALEHVSGTTEGCNIQHHSTNAPYLFVHHRRYIILASENKIFFNVKTSGVFSKVN